MILSNVRFLNGQKLKQILATLMLGLVLVDALVIDWKAVDNKIEQKIISGYFTGCVLGVYTPNSTLYKKAYGTLTPKWGLYSPPITQNTFFDLGYITQVIGINSGLMELQDLDKLHIKDRVSKHYHEFDNNGKRDITIENLLLHNSGLQYTYEQPFGSNSTELLKKINDLKLQYRQQTKYQYSELGFVVLGQLISKINNKPLQISIGSTLQIAGLSQTKYKPNKESRIIVPSTFAKQSIIGLPRNKIARFINGVAGNAGLFSNLENIGYYMQLMLNKGKMHLSLRIFSESAVNLFTSRVSMKKYFNTRALGWETKPIKDPPCGSKFSQNSFGLSDESGSYVWADKDKNISIVLLAAGSYPIQNRFLNQARAQGQISDEIMTALGY